MLSIIQILANFWLILLIFIQIIAIIGFLIPVKVKKIKLQPSVSVIIAVWNEAPRIEKCISSLLEQEYPKKKIEIIVAGGGDDGTVEICKKLEKAGKIKYLYEKVRKGKWFALNRALKRAKNETIAFIDGDCVADKNWIKNLVSNLDYGDIIISHPFSVTEKGFNGKMFSIFYFFFTTFQVSLTKVFKVSNFFGFGSLVKREVVEKIKFRKSLVEDWKFSFDATKNGFKSVYADGAYIYHHIPKNLNGLRKQILRVMNGYYSEMILEDLYSIFLVLLPLTSFIGIPFSIYSIVSGNFLPILTLIIALAILFFLVFLFAIKEKKIKYVAYIPLLIIFYLWFVVTSLEALIRRLIGKENGWPLYEKAG